MFTCVNLCLTPVAKVADVLVGLSDDFFSDD